MVEAKELFCSIIDYVCFCKCYVYKAPLPPFQWSVPKCEIIEASQKPVTVIYTRRSRVVSSVGLHVPKAAT